MEHYARTWIRGLVCVAVPFLVLGGCSATKAATETTTPVQGCDAKVVAGVRQLLAHVGDTAADNQLIGRFTTQYGQHMTQNAIVPIFADVTPLVSRQGTQAAVRQAGTEAHEYCGVANK